jgi:hypothetical protein
MFEPKIMRRIIFHTAEEYEAGREKLDSLLAWCWTAQHEILERLPASRETELARQGLEQFACYARLAILAESDKA